MKFDTDIVVFDLEASCKTFGANEIEESNIIELAAVRVDRKSLEITGEFTALVKPRDYCILPQIADITHITPDMTEGEPFFDEVFPRFLQWYGPRNKSILASFGIYYDMPLLRKECRAFGFTFADHFIGSGLDVRSLCHVWLARHGHGTSGLSVEKALMKMGLPSIFNYHRALDDAKATALIFQHVCRQP